MSNFYGAPNTTNQTKAMRGNWQSINGIIQDYAHASAQSAQNALGIQWSANFPYGSHHLALSCQLKSLNLSEVLPR